jgi:phosphoglycerol transferase
MRNFYQRHHHPIRASLRFITYFSGFFLALLAYWVGDNFGEPSLEQVLYHLQFGMDGLVDTDTALIRSFVMWCLLLPLLCSVLLVVIEYSIAMFIVHGSEHWITRPARLGNIRVLKGLYWTINHRAPIYFLMFGFVYFAMQFSLSAYIHHRLGQDYFSMHYLDPHGVKVTPVKPKNLVLIYVESLENSYQKPTLFDKNLLTSLDQFKGLTFSDFRQAPGTGWTIAGMIATQCGIPLKSVSLYDGNGVGENIKTFLPNAICLGDILHAAGYYNVFMGGDALNFSGKGKFYREHHYQEVYGKDELRGNLKDSELNYWGLYDDDLLAAAKQKLKQLHQSGQRFNFTISTIDTHGPDGHYSRYCVKNGVNNFPKIVECTANQVAQLVQFIKQSGMINDTQIVITGDHLAMENPVYDTVEKNQQRRIYNQFISRQKFDKNRDQILHFDMYPTILSFIGFSIEHNKLGLGFNALSESTEIPPEHQFEEMDKDLLNQSERYLQLWDPNYRLDTMM